MKKLYGIAERHRKQHDFYLLASLPAIANAYGFNSENFSTVFEKFSKLAKLNDNDEEAVYRRKVDATRKLVAGKKPKVFFLEGLPREEYGCKRFLRDVGYKGKAVFLDERYRPMETLFEKRDELVKKSEKLMSKSNRRRKRLENLRFLREFLGLFPESFKKVARPVYKRTLLKAIENSGSLLDSEILRAGNMAHQIFKEDMKADKHIDHLDREQYWEGLIKAKFRDPSAIQTGILHQDPRGKKGIGILAPLLKLDGIELETVYMDPYQE